MLSVALALPDDGKVLACDICDEYSRVGVPQLRVAGVAHKIDLQLAPALTTRDARINANESDVSRGTQHVERHSAGHFSLKVPESLARHRVFRLEWR